MAESFKSAFAAARKAGKKAFTWNGKSYNTELAETVRPKPRGSGEPMRPKARDPGKNPKPSSVGTVVRPRARGDMGAIFPKPRPVKKTVRDTRRDKSNPIGFDFDAQREAAKKKKK